MLPLIVTLLVIFKKLYLSLCLDIALWCSVDDTDLPMECCDSQPVAVGLCCTWQLKSRLKPKILCILCQEEQPSEILVYASCIQRSSVLCCPESLDQCVPGELVN